MIRSRDKSTTVSYPQVETMVNGSRVFRTLSVAKLDRMDDEVTHRFKKRSALGEIFIKPMTKVSTNPVLLPINFWKQKVVNKSTGQVNRWSVDRSDLYANYVPWTDPAILSVISKLEALAITDAYAGVGSADVATLTELAELRETLSFLMSPARKLKEVTGRLSRYIRAVKRVEEGYAKRLAKWRALPERVKARRKKPEVPNLPKLRLGKFEAVDIPSAWLAYRYAIMPLVYTIQDIQKHLDREIMPIRDTSRAKQAEDVDLKLDGTYTSYYNGYGDTKERILRRGKASIVSRAGVLYAPDWSLNRQLGLQIHRVPMALYEAIPLSFVADWLWNGAAVYDALTAELRAIKIHGAWVTTEVKFDLDGYVEAVPLNPETTCAGSVHTTQVTGKWRRRKLASVSDVRVHLRVEMNSKRVADALSLTAVMLSSLIGKKR